MRVDRSMRAPDPRFFARKVACGTPICSSCWYVYRRCCPDMYAGTTTSEKITQTGKRFASWKEGGPKWGRQDHKLDGESVAQARLPIIIEIQDLHTATTACRYRECHCASYPASLFSVSSPVPAGLT
jgi:hypothetical protein